MGWLRRLFRGRQKSSDLNAANESGFETSIGQAMLVQIFLDRVKSSDLIGDIAALEDDLQEILGDECDVDGHDVGAEDAIVYVYGNDAESIFAVVRSYLKSHALTKQAEVTLRFGPPGAAKQVISLQ